jgi:serine/threonine protein kinase
MMTSPDNDADVKIVDFGFAAEASGKTLREQLGTPAYIAPEIIKNESYGMIPKNYFCLWISYSACHRKSRRYVVIWRDLIYFTWWIPTFPCP